MAVVDSVLVILGRSLLPCAPESGPQLTWLVVCSLTTDSICLSAIPLYPSTVIPLLSSWPNNASVALDVTMGFRYRRNNFERWAAIRSSLLVTRVSGVLSQYGLQLRHGVGPQWFRNWRTLLYTIVTRSGSHLDSCTKPFLHVINVGKQEFILHHIGQLLACKRFIEVCAPEFSPPALAVARSRKSEVARPYLSDVSAI
jgi:hypothetical protein